MSTVFILAPVIIGSWPAISAAVAGAAAAMGFAMAKSADDKRSNIAQDQQEQQDDQRTIKIEIKDSAVLAGNLMTGQSIEATRGHITIRVHRDERGRCSVCASGVNVSDNQLRQVAEEFTERLTQCFVYNKIMTELKQKGFRVVNEKVEEDQSVRIHVRRWEN